MAISAPGVGSGLDVNSIISQLVALERRPIQQIQTQVNSLQTSISSWGQIKSKLAGLQDAAAELLKSDLWKGNAATTSDDAILGVSGTGGALAGSYSVKVQSLAQAQSTRTTAGFASGSPAGLEGRLELTLGTWTGTNFTSTSTAVSIAVGSSDTLSDIARKINDEDAGISAVVIRNGTQESLVLKSKQTGSSNGFEVRAYDASDVLVTDGITGLGALSYFNNGVSVIGQTLNYSAQDAALEVDGVSVKSSTNTFSDVITGLTLEAKSESASIVSLTVKADKDSMVERIKGFQKAFNELTETIKTLTKADPTGSGNGPLRGDQAAIGILTALRGYVGDSVSGTGPNRLLDIGLSFDRSGNLSLNESDLNAALASPEELSNLFSEATSGIARRIRDFVQDSQAFGGSAASREQALLDTVKRKNEEIARLEERVARSEDRIRAQYTALDAKMAQYNGLSSYISQQLSVWAR